MNLNAKSPFAVHSYLHVEPWGYSIWQGGKQTGAGVGLNPLAFRDLALSLAERRMWRKRGLYRLPS